MPIEQLGTRALITAAVGAHRWANAHEDVRTYHRRRYDLLREQLGVDLDVLADGRNSDREQPRDTSGLPELLRETIVQMAEPTSPFAGYLEAPRAVTGTYQRHKAALRAADEALQAALAGLAEDLFTQLWPELLNRTTTARDLSLAGLPAYADPLDHL